MRFAILAIDAFHPVDIISLQITVKNNETFLLCYRNQPMHFRQIFDQQIKFSIGQSTAGPKQTTNHTPFNQAGKLIE